MRTFLKQFGPSIATLGILVYLAGFARLEIVTTGVPQFMERSKNAIYSIPLNIGSWSGETRKIDEQAKELLKPNAELSMLYKSSAMHVEAFFTVVQVTDARHITGHAPKNCYPGSGWKIHSETPKTWTLGDQVLSGIEYRVERPLATQSQRWNVRSIFIHPDGTTGSTLLDLDRAAEDYRKLKYGVAHVQLVTMDHPSITDQKRDEIFRQLVGSEKSLEMIRILRSGIPK